MNEEHTNNPSSEVLEIMGNDVLWYIHTQPWTAIADAHGILTKGYNSIVTKNPQGASELDTKIRSWLKKQNQIKIKQTLEP